MANNDEYTDEYNDDYLCRDFFVGSIFRHKITIYRRESLAELCHTLHCACSISWQVSCESFMRK